MNNLYKLSILTVFFLSGMFLQLSAQAMVFHQDSLGQKVDSLTMSIYESHSVARKAQLPHIPIQKMEKRDKIAVTIIFVSAWSAYITKKQADFYYKKYQHTGNPEEIRLFWDKSRKYDKISDTFIIVSYISTAYIMKRLLF